MNLSTRVAANASRRLAPVVTMALWIGCSLWFTPTAALAESGSYADIEGATQQRLAKLYGAGGVRGLEGQQTGLFVHAAGLLLTVDSVLLESGEVTVVTFYGDRYSGRVAAIDRLTGLALLRIDVAEDPPPWFELTDGDRPAPAEPVWALSNAFGIAAGDEPVTVQRGVVSTIARLESAGPFGAPPGLGEVIVLDAVTSNPGAAGGAVVDDNGRLLGMIGQETRSRVTGGWFNYAIPTGQLHAAAERLLASEADGRREETPEGLTPGDDRLLATARLRDLGLVLIPPITDQTPAYVEQVTEGSAAESAGLMVDDLIVSVAGRTVGAVVEASVQIVRAAERGGAVDVTVLRGKAIVTVRLPKNASSANGSGS